MQTLTLFPKEALQKMCQEYLNLAATHYTNNPGVELPPCLTVITMPNPRQLQTWHIEPLIVPSMLFAGRIP